MSNDVANGERTTASVKGTAFSSVVESYLALVSQGRVSEALQSKYLTDADQDLIEGVVTSIGWYPIESYDHVLDLLAEVESGGDRSGYLIARGWRAAERLMGGTYQQLEVPPGAWGGRAGEMILGLGKLIYNFTTWSYSEPEPGVHEVKVDNAALFPDTARYTAQGFLDYFATHSCGRRIHSTSHRADGGTIVFQFQMDASDTGS